MNATYTIRESRLEELRGQIAKLNRKAAKLGATPVTITIGSETIFKKRHVVVTDGEFEVERRTVQIACREVTVEGEAPKLNGWSLEAAVEYIGESPILHKLTDNELPERFRTQGAICEHCNHNRRRRYLYAVRHEDGTWKQVGSTCLADFTGTNDPHRVASYIEFLRDIIIGMDSDEGEYEHIPQGEWWIGLEQFLSYACAAIRLKGGFVGRRRARDEEKFATADRAWASLTNGRRGKEDWMAFPEEEDTAKAADVLRWATDDLSNRDEMNDFEYNLATLAKAGRTDDRNAGIAAAMVFAYDREQEQKAEADAAIGHIGTEGERGDFELTVKKITYGVGYYEATLVKFEDAEGHQAVWFASGEPEIEEGATYKVRATVRKHGQYRGIDQTTLTRCKVEQRETVAA